MDSRKSTTAVSKDDDQLITDQDLIADQEARNGLLQFDEVERLISAYATQKRLDLTAELVQSLNRIAVQGLRKSAGRFRDVPVSISNTPHVPPAHEEVQGYVTEMCMYVNANWNVGSDDVESAIHISAYLMWRLNWIHPFRDGNGRTSRAVSYLALAVRSGRELGGDRTIADQIVDNKDPYYAALDSADEAWEEGKIDVSRMEQLIYDLLVVQLASA